MGKEVLVFIAKLVWTNPQNYVRGEKYYCIDDGKVRHFSNIKCTMEELADTMHKGRYLSEPVYPQDKIIFKPPCKAETIYGDGYFGRPLVPSRVYCYESLKRKQIKQLENHLARLRRA